MASNEGETPGKHLHEDSVFNGKLPNYLGDAYPDPFYEGDHDEADRLGKLPNHLGMLILVHFMKENYLEKALRELESLS